MRTRGSSDALRRRPGRRGAARLRDPSPRRRHDDRGVTTATRISRRWSARPGPRGRMLGWGRSRGPRAAALGDPSNRIPARRRGARPCDGSDRPFPVRRDAGAARARLRRAAVAHPAIPPGRRRSSSLRRSMARRSLGASAHLNESKRIPQVLRAFADFPPSRHPSARLLLVGAEAPGLRSCRAGWSGWSSTAKESSASRTSRKSGSGRSCPPATRASCCARPTMGGDLGECDPHAVAGGSRSSVSDVGWFAELPDDVALKVPVGEGEVEALVAAMRRLAEPAVAARMGEARAGVCPLRARPRRGRRGVRRRARAGLAARAPSKPRFSEPSQKRQADTGVDPARIRAGAHRARSRRRKTAACPQQRGLTPARGQTPRVGGRALRGRGRGCSLRSDCASSRRGSWSTSLSIRTWPAASRTPATSSSAACTRITALCIRSCCRPRTRSSARRSTSTSGRAVINALAMCSVVFPTYLLARRVVRPGFAFAAAALANRASFYDLHRHVDDRGTPSTQSSCGSRTHSYVRSSSRPSGARSSCSRCAHSPSSRGRRPSRLWPLC